MASEEKDKDQDDSAGEPSGCRTATGDWHSGGNLPIFTEEEKIIIRSLFKEPFGGRSPNSRETTRDILKADERFREWARDGRRVK